MIYLIQLDFLALFSGAARCFRMTRIKVWFGVGPLATQNRRMTHDMKRNRKLPWVSGVSLNRPTIHGNCRNESLSSMRWKFSDCLIHMGSRDFMEFVQREIFVAGADNYPEAIQYKSGGLLSIQVPKNHGQFSEKFGPGKSSKTSWGYGPSARSLDS